MTGPWAGKAACRGADPELFFPQQGENGTVAKALCRRCPVVDDCLDWGLRHEKHGVWGGTTEKERRVLRRKLGIVCNVPEAAGTGSLLSAFGYRREYDAG